MGIAWKERSHESVVPPSRSRSAASGIYLGFYRESRVL